MNFLTTHAWLSIIPPLVTVFIAIRFKQIFVALFIGLWAGSTLMTEGDVFLGFIRAIERCLAVFQDPGSTKIILFCCFIGAIMAFAQRSGGVAGFIELLSKHKIVKNRKQAQLLTVAVGAMIPVESSINILVPGSISRPLYDKYGISREKLAFLTLSFSAPICTLVPANAWGAYVSGIIGAMGIASPYHIYLRSIPWNVYSILAIGLALFLILIQKDFFAMAKAEEKARAGGSSSRTSSAASLMGDEVLSLKPKEGVVPRASNMLVPVGGMVAAMLAGMFITGHGKFTAGSGATSVFYAVVFAILAAGIKYKLGRIMKFGEMMDLFIKSVGGLFGMGLLITLSFALSKLCLDMNTGPFVAGLTKGAIDIKFIPAILFLVTSFISFTTGTSWGAWAIMLPIGLGFFDVLNTPAMITVGAIMSGGVFGNHSSPIADTTIMASLAAGSDVIDNVRAVLPYALLTLGLTTAVYAVLGFLFI